MKRRIPPLVILTALVVCASSCTHLQNSPAKPKLERYEFIQPQMGVAFRIVLYSSDNKVAESAAQAAFDRIRKLNDILSDYEEESELNRLSRSSDTHVPVRVSPDLWIVLLRAQTLAQRSEGAFDVTIGPCVNLWRRARRQHRLPAPGVLEKARKAVGFEQVRLDLRNRTAQLLVPGMRLDLGGIAKGYAVDEAMKVLLAHGISRALIGGDGDILAADPPPGKPGWRVGIASLDVPNSPTNQLVLLKRAAISTSGDLSQRLEIEGKRYSHIIDPRIGIGLTDHSLVTVIARDSTTADSLATAVSVLGPEKGLKLVEATPGAAARILRQPQDRLERHESKRFKVFLLRTD